MYYFCLFLSNTRKLVEYLSKLRDEVVKSGDLAGLVLTGIDEQGSGIQLLQSYLAKTDDLQTVALIVSQVSKRKIFAPEVERWIEL